VVAVLAGCATPTTAGPPAASPPPAAASTPAAARPFTSRHYHYTAALPPGWTGAQASKPWNGKGAPGDEDPTVDLFQGPGGVEAWTMAAPTRENLAAYTKTISRASAAGHPCPAVPQTSQAITIGGAPARLLGMDCPPGSGFLVELAITLHHGTGYVFASQNPTSTPAIEPADRAAFRAFLAGISFKRSTPR
jgi:hypothetical protein